MTTDPERERRIELHALRVQNHREWREPRVRTKRVEYRRHPRRPIVCTRCGAECMSVRHSTLCGRCRRALKGRARLLEIKRAKGVA